MTQKDLERDFSRKTIKLLKKARIQIIGKTWLPGKDGSFANGETGYKVDNMGTSQIKTYQDLLNVAFLMEEGV